MKRKKYNRKNDIMRLLLVMINEMKNPTRFYIAKGLIKIKTDIPLNRLYEAISFLMAEKSGVETTQRFITLNRELFKEFLEKEFPELHRVVTDD